MVIRGIGLPAYLTEQTGKNKKIHLSNVAFDKDSARSGEGQPLAKGKDGGIEMSDLSNTQFFQVEPGPQISAKDILEIVYKALKEKGYNPVNQIVGYVMSGDPTYITSYNGARSLVMKVERDELVEELLKAYIQHNAWA